MKHIEVQKLDSFHIEFTEGVEKIESQERKH